MSSSPGSARRHPLPSIGTRRTAPHQGRTMSKRAAVDDSDSEVEVVNPSVRSSASQSYLPLRPLRRTRRRSRPGADCCNLSTRPTLTHQSPTRRHARSQSRRTMTFRRSRASQRPRGRPTRTTRSTRRRMRRGSGPRFRVRQRTRRQE